MEFAFIKGLGLGLFLAISVGPIIFTILNLSIKCGHKAGYAFIGGVSLSDVLLVIVGNVAAELVKDALKYQTYIAIGGACLLIGMGVYSFFFGKDPAMDSGELPPDFRRRDVAKFSLQGFFMNILNPGPIIFWLTTCTAFSYLPLSERMVLFATSLLVVFFTDYYKVKLAGKIKGWLTPSTLHKIHQLSALILIGFGVIIAAGLAYTHWHS